MKSRVYATAVVDDRLQCCIPNARAWQWEPVNSSHVKSCDELTVVSDGVVTS